MSLGLGEEEQINVPIAPEPWQVQVGAAAGLLLCALLKVVGASGDTGGENYGWFLKALTVQLEKQPGSGVQGQRNSTEDHVSSEVIPPATREQIEKTAQVEEIEARATGELLYPCR